jgi:UDP-galactose transporter B1
MARTKQATPLRRDPSSEYFSKADATGTPSRSARNLNKDLSNGNTTNGHTNGTVLKDLFPVAQKEAGPLQFVIAVGGIYGTL